MVGDEREDRRSDMYVRISTYASVRFAGWTGVTLAGGLDLICRVSRQLKKTWKAIKNWGLFLFKSFHACEEGPRVGGIIVCPSDMSTDALPSSKHNTQYIITNT